MDRRGYALYFSRSPIPYRRRAALATPLRHVGMYGYQRAALLELAATPPAPLEQTESLEQLRALENGMRIRVLLASGSGIGVDTLADLEKARRLAAAGSLAPTSGGVRN
jgi:3-deoxy-manno-octulosonate cytidylyltransferase (CMP-KDO synthetase)